VLFAVSDGMGGAVAGEIASDLSVNGVREELVRLAHIQDVSERLRRAVETTNRVVYDHAQANPQLSGMGATLTAVLLHGGRAYIAQVGDSRAYLIAAGDGPARQLTTDHTVVERLIECGEIEPAERHSHRLSGALYLSIGGRLELAPELGADELAAGDIVLLCSDGLVKHVADEEIAQIARAETAARACEQLIALANQRGGEDNISLAIVRWDG